MIQFQKLRINGFKSFVDRTELEITPGLNGIVGPNGCGKSNLVEALRWVMGESSAKRMRGGGMEDVIFNGTDKRSARNIAEVALLLNNSSRSAPAAYNATEEIEIIRRIERDHGSNYKINGKNVRARDVQMLFADTVTGANSPALVSQGQVAKIINSKPLERRLILEESAGISGLYARRHEAELRLKGADTNLKRVEDVLLGMETRLNALKRQARQAGRYRNISTQIRQLEVLIAWLEWNSLDEKRAATMEKFKTAESLVTEKLTAVTQLTKTQNTQAEDLPALRKAEAEIAAEMQSKKITLQRLEDQAQRQKDMLHEAESQLVQARTDQAHETQMAEEGAATMAKLETEQSELLSQQNDDENKIKAKQSAKDALEKKVVQLEEEYTALMQSTAEAKARQQSLEQQLRQNKERINTVNERKTKAKTELETLKNKENFTKDIENIYSNINKKEKELQKLDKEIEAAHAGMRKAKETTEAARSALRSAETQNSEFSAEITMLQRFFEGRDENSFSPVLDDVAAESGFEKALSRALGDALLASVDEKAPMRWISRKTPASMPALPEGIGALLPRVKAPKELHLALSQIGYVDADHVAQSFIDALKPGQSIVSRSGSYWRWDGYHVEAEATDRNAVHLEQKNKLKELQKKQPSIQKALEKAEQALKAAQNNEAAQEKSYEELQATQKTTSETLNKARLEHSELRERQARLDSEKARLGETVRMADEDIKTLQEVIKWDEDRLKTYTSSSNEKKEADTAKLRESLLAAREAYQDALRSFDRYIQQQNSRKARLHAIADERVNLQNRVIRSKERLKELDDRKKALAEKLEELRNRPGSFKDESEKLLSEVSVLEERRSGAAEKLAAQESELAETNRALKEAERILGESRESRAHAEATLSAIQEQSDTMVRAIREKFDMAPDSLKEHAAIDIEQSDENLESFRSKKEKLMRERDNIGPVNLRADDEAQELEKDVTTLLHERNDLMQAIDELRSGINKINKEARERLLGAFDHVNAHFQHLFTRLFGGGKAHLALIDSEETNNNSDPLVSGLEIYAQPPGKTLQSLSLLSGGEQTLASIALIFAMFLTNPSPICVLDEIDAPLDDANVDRVCDLLEEIAERGETRFLIITHHRLTMARMDRLYGVTMSEQGVSQLVSVDLQQSFDFLEEAA